MKKRNRGKATKIERNNWESQSQISKGEAKIEKMRVIEEEMNEEYSKDPK